MKTQECELMLVEDDPDIRETLAELLEDEGYHVAQAGDGREALERLGAQAEAPPCLILLDLMMPVMDGWTLRRRLLADPGLKEVPVIVITGVADGVRRAQNLDALAVLEKPLDLERLLTLVGEHC